MNAVNRTLYIPLYGKAKVSRAGAILRDEKAEEIWAKEGFPLRGGARSKWLAYYLAMRARVFDEWTRARIAERPDALVLHVGCGLDSRALRAGQAAWLWYDVDFPEVVAERAKYYRETETYHMLGADATAQGWTDALPDAERAIVVLEGIAMYLPGDAQRALLLALQARYPAARVLADVYTPAGARATKVKNPINTVGVSRVYGVPGPESLAANGGIRFLREHDMTPRTLVNELKGFDRAFFALLFAGGMARRLYRLYEYELSRP